MSLKKVFKTDSNKEKDGVWISMPQGDDSPDCEFLVLPQGPSNKKYTAALTASQKKYKHTVKTMSQEKQQQVFAEIFADTVLLDWKNVEEYRKEKLTNDACMMPFNKENAIFLLSDLPQVLEVLSREASDFANFVDASVEDDAKN